MSPVFKGFSGWPITLSPKCFGGEVSSTCWRMTIVAQNIALTQNLVDFLSTTQGVRNFVFALFTSSLTEQERQDKEQRLESDQILLERLEAAAKGMGFAFEDALYRAFNGRALRPDIKRWQVVNWAIMELAIHWDGACALSYGELERYNLTMESMWLALCGESPTQATYSKRFMAQMASALLNATGVSTDCRYHPDNNITLTKQEYEETQKQAESTDS